MVNRAEIRAQSINTNIISLLTTTTTMTEKLETNVSKLRDDANKAPRVNLLTKWIDKGKQPSECFFIKRNSTLIHNAEAVGVPSVDEIVGGDLYPTCIECFNDNTDCLWEFGVIRARMEQLDSESTCERCRLNGGECQFVWGVVDSVKKIEDTMGRLVRHAHSQHRKTARALGKNDVARKGIQKVMAELSTLIN
jgi:hypothetical protein